MNRILVVLEKKEDLFIISCIGLKAPARVLSPLIKELNLILDFENEMWGIHDPGHPARLMKFGVFLPRTEIRDNLLKQSVKLAVGIIDKDVVAHWDELGVLGNEIFSFFPPD